MSKIKYLPVVILAGICLLVLSTIVLAEQTTNRFETMSKPDREVIIDKIAAEAMTSEDGGLRAKEACNLGLELGNTQILSNALRNKVVGVRVYCLKKLEGGDSAVAAESLAKALQDSTLWSRPQKIGELIAEYAIFEERFVEVVADLLDRSSEEITVAEESSREALAAELLSLSRQRKNVSEE